MIKKSLFATILLVATLFSNVSYSQAWEKQSKVLGLGLGAASFWHLNNGFTTPITGQLNFKMEFGVHDYVGVGFQTGVGGGGPLGVGVGWGRRGVWGGSYYSDYNGSFNFPVAAYANFHFYQLIADNTQKNIHADKLDIYAGLNIGSGIALSFYRDGGRRVSALAFGGPHVGIRYYFSPRVGINGELGWGKSLINFGFAFKI
jgi:hypothetical protein